MSGECNASQTQRSDLLTERFHGLSRPPTDRPGRNRRDETRCVFLSAGATATHARAVRAPPPRRLDRSATRGSAPLVRSFSFARSGVASPDRRSPPAASGATMEMEEDASWREIWWRRGDERRETRCLARRPRVHPPLPPALPPTSPRPTTSRRASPVPSREVGTLDATVRVVVVSRRRLVWSLVSAASWWRRRIVSRDSSRAQRRRRRDHDALLPSLSLADPRLAARPHGAGWTFFFHLRGCVWSARRAPSSSSRVESSSSSRECTRPSRLFRIAASRRHRARNPGASFFAGVVALVSSRVSPRRHPRRRRRGDDGDRLFPSSNSTPFPRVRSWLGSFPARSTSRAHGLGWGVT